MTDLTPFEQRLSERLGHELAAALRPFDPAAVAMSAIGRRSPLDRFLNRLGLGPLPMRAAARQVALVAVAALLALATLALAIALAKPGGAGLVFVRANGDVVVAAPDGSDQHVIFQVESPIIYTQLVWAPDGRHFALVDESQRLTILDRAGRATHLPEVEGAFPTIAWAPDGQRLAVSHGGSIPGEVAGGPPQVHPRLDILRSDGTLEWTVPLPEAFRHVLGLGDLSWSADGRWLTTTGTTLPGTEDRLPSSVWRVDTHDRVVDEVTEAAPDRHDHQARWLPQGDLLVSRAGIGILRLDPESGTTSTVLELDPQTCPDCTRLARLYDLAPNGEQIAILHPAEGIAVLDLRTGAITGTGFRFNAALGPYQVRWLDAGRALAVNVRAMTNAPPQVIAVDLGSGEFRQIVAGTPFYDLVN